MLEGWSLSHIFYDVRMCMLAHMYVVYVCMYMCRQFYTHVKFIGMQVGVAIINCICKPCSYFTVLCGAQIYACMFSMCLCDRVSMSVCVSEQCYFS